MAIRIPHRYLTFTDKVKRCYKKSLRNLEDFMIQDRVEFRIESRKMRAKFDDVLNCPDPVKANTLLADREKDLFQNQHWQPRKFPQSYGGVAYMREIQAPDWVLDYWHPLEKARYPEYFARREQRKKEYVEWWDKTYGKPTNENHH